MKVIVKFWMGMLILIILSPLGLILPQYFKASGAWGEWGIDEMKELVGYIPKGLEKLSTFWSAPLPDYTFKGWEDKPIAALSFAYIISAVLGILLVVLIVLLLGKAILKKDK
jgi:hypothetical protein